MLHDAMIPIQHLERGTKIKLKNGLIAEVTENPKDGAWLYARICDPGSEERAEEIVNADDVVEVLD